MAQRFLGLIRMSSASLLRAPSHFARALSRPPRPDERDEDLSPEVEAFFDQADELADVFRRRRFQPLLLSGAALTAVLLFGAGYLARATLFDTSPETSVAAGNQNDQEAAQLLLDEVVPAEGFTVDAGWGDVLPRLVEAGVIDVAKFQETALRAGAPLTEDQLRLLREPSDEKLRIDRSNTYFVLNVLWAVGLADASDVISKGPLAQAGPDKARLASTAGWSLGQKPGPEYLGALELLPLTPEQEQVVMHVASHSYRPCCNNPTAFPDCNHGSAALGLATIMASQGASDDEIFRALKTFNAYWFPEAYYKLALLFQGQGTEWEDVDASLVMGREYSSLSGAGQVDAALRAQGSLPQIQGGAGGSCAQ